MVASARAAHIGRTPHLAAAGRVPESTPVLVGRAPELEVLSARLSALRGATGFALLLLGEPGIGKTALLDELARAAGEDATVLRARGLEAEAELPFAAVRALLAPVLDRRERLPPLYARALAGALALEEPSPSDGFAVAIALHALLSEAARERPVLALVDDLHWLDPASRDALLFVARRLGGAGVGLVLAAREVEARAFDSAGIERLTVAPLAPDPARTLVRWTDAEVVPAVRDELVDAAAGNPLALLEVTRSLSDAQRRGQAPLGPVLEPGPLLQEAFARRIAALDPAALRAATVAAAMERGPVAWLLAALARLEQDAPSGAERPGDGGAPSGAGPPAARARAAAAEALDAAERADFVVVADDGVAAFRHPLIRAAAYHAVGPGARRAAHAALAATAPDPRRRAAHLSDAVAGADETVAAELEEAAAHARAVGGHAEAGAAYARAAELSTDAAHRGRRALAAAEGLVVAGDTERALRLLEVAERDAEPAAIPVIVRLRGHLAMRRGDPQAALDLLVAEGERQLAAGAPAEGTALLLEASVGLMLAGHLDRQIALVDRARPAARELGGEPAALIELLDAEVLVVRGDALGGERALTAAAERLADVDLLAHSEIVGMAGQMALWLGASTLAEQIVEAFLDAARKAGAVGRMPYPLSVRAQLGYRRGAWAEAAADADEGVRLAETTGQAMMLAFTLGVRARLAAGQGRVEAGRADLGRALGILGEDAPNVAVHVHAAHGHLELIAGDPRRAVAPLLRAAELDERLGLGELAGPMWAGDLIEALVAAGRGEEAPRWVARAAAGASRWSVAMAARGRLLTAADDADVPALADAALAAHETLDFPYERARTELLVGERLRRTRARAAARAPLGRALETFERLGAQPLARRASAELEASGAGAGGGVAQLTEEQRRIAALVAEGRTNREIAGELFVSAKTLERRLTQIYRRAGVTSRLELARLVAEQEAA